MPKPEDPRVETARKALDALQAQDLDHFLELFDDAVVVNYAGTTVFGRRALGQLSERLIARCRSLRLHPADVATSPDAVVLVFDGRAVVNGESASHGSVTRGEVDLEGCAVLGFTHDVISRCSLYWSGFDVIDMVRSDSKPRRDRSDEHEIQQLMARYAHAVDNRDFPTVRACFTEDATAEYSGMELAGVADIVDYIAGVERYPATQHIFGPSHIRVAGDTAAVSSHAVSHIVVPGDSGERLMSRGLTYHDELVRTTAGWQITRRVHRPHWGTMAQLDWGGWPPGHPGPDPLP